MESGILPVIRISGQLTGGTMLPEGTPEPEDIKAAAIRIAPYAHKTPLLTSHTLDEITGVHVLLKCENLQKVGAFKARGACNAVFSLSDEEAARGVVTHSSGNHAQALAFAARTRGIPASIVMPRTAPKVKVDAVRGYGATINFCEPNLEARTAAAEEIINRTGATMVHPYNDARVIAGQATCALEIIQAEQTSAWGASGAQAGERLDVIMCPVGGGGLTSGTALSARYFGSGIKVVAAEPAGADDAWRSFTSRSFVPQTGPKTIADGLLTSLGALGFGIILETVSDIVTVSEESIIAAMRLLWERCKLVVEPSGAVPLAALLEGKGAPKGSTVAIILSGGNVDLEKLPWMKGV
jgi:threonine dehydratase